jgi:hypothetical protein
MRKALLERNGERSGDRIPCGVEDARGEMTVVEVDRENGVCPELVEEGLILSGKAPARIAIPPAALDIEGDVVTDRTRARLASDLVTAIAEGDRAREAIATTRSVGEVLERSRESELEPLSCRRPSDRQVPEELRGFAIGGDEQARRFPTLSPLRFTKAGRVEVVPKLRETLGAATDRDAAVCDSLLERMQSRFENLQEASLLK